MPSGGIVDLAPPFPARIFDAANETGIYSLEQKLPGEILKQHFAVNTPAESESDLLSENRYSWGTGGSGASKTAQTPRSVNLQPYLLWGILRNKDRAGKRGCNTFDGGS